MHIAIDDLPLRTGHEARGVGMYTKELIASLPHVSSHTYTLYSGKTHVPERIDLVHIPYFDPFFLTLPFHISIPFVVTVHDLIPIHFSEHFPRGVRGEIKWQIQKRLLGRARAIVTDSHWSKRDIIDIVGYPSDRIHVVPLAPRELFFQKHSAAEKQKILKKYNLPSDYLLYVGDVNWNKNLPTVFFALKQLQHHKKDIQIVLVGSAHKNENLPETAALKALIKELKIDDMIHTPGYVPDSDLAILYDAAKVCIQPSFAEGFGLAPLESMASGTPAIVSTAPALVEIAGPSKFFDPHDASAIATCIQDVYALSSRQYEMWCKQSKEYAIQFHWEKTAKATAQVYEMVA